MKGEKEAGHKGLREVGNVDPDTEITFQFGADEQNRQGEKSNQKTFRLTKSNLSVKGSSKGCTQVVLTCAPDIRK